jgi:hypothetical protein
MPGQPDRACARFRNVPWRFTLENRQLPLALPRSFSRLRSPTFSLHPTLRQIVALCNRKTLPPCAETVDHETSLWKTEENLRRIVFTEIPGALHFIVSLRWTQVFAVFHPVPHAIRDPFHPLHHVPGMNAARFERRRLFRASLLLLAACPTRSLS